MSATKIGPSKKLRTEHRSSQTRDSVLRKLFPSESVTNDLSLAFNDHRCTRQPKNLSGRSFWQNLGPNWSDGPDWPTLAMSQPRFWSETRSDFFSETKCWSKIVGNLISDDVILFLGVFKWNSYSLKIIQEQKWPRTFYTMYFAGFYGLCTLIKIVLISKKGVVLETKLRFKLELIGLKLRRWERAIAIA